DVAGDISVDAGDVSTLAAYVSQLPTSKIRTLLLLRVFICWKANRTYNGYRVRLASRSAAAINGTARRGSRPMSDVTVIIDAINAGDADAPAQLLPLVYDELRRLAAHKLAQEPVGQTLQPTALVHEAYLRLLGAPGENRWDSRGHFFAAAAR